MTRRSFLKTIGMVCISVVAAREIIKSDNGKKLLAGDYDGDVASSKSFFLEKQMKLRREYKKKALLAYKAGDLENYRNYNSKQLKLFYDMNTTYGIRTNNQLETIKLIRNV